MKYDYIVDPEGNGTHATLQAALDDAGKWWPRLRRAFRRAHVGVMPGIYRDAVIDCSFADLEGI